MRATSDEAMETLFHRFGRLVYRVAFQILRDAGEAEDVTQEIFLELYRKAHLYDPSRGSVRVWILQYAYHRSLRRKVALLRRAGYLAEPLDEDTWTADGHPTQLTPEERRWVLRAALSQLPARQRATLELTCFEELSLRDVAARLRVSLGCARHYYYRGLARLRAWARAATLTDPALRALGGTNRVSLDKAIQLVPREAELAGGAPLPERVPFEDRDHPRGRGQRLEPRRRRRASGRRGTEAVASGEALRQVLGPQQ
jgi:RNA polymerase sigma-70 factor (ECF subfamily)